MRKASLNCARRIPIGGLAVLALCSCGGGGGGAGDDGSTEPRPPVAGGDVATTIEGQSVTINVLANDSDPAGSPLTVSVSIPVDLGVGVVNADQTITFTP